ncbi:MAG: aminodeoxychorismate/anthranilate synthase component II [Oscillospiraceae bacterium]|nr:aminodeoxychorismate/anthranilate synthase component II [Oscillospiraceae bacterium]
MVLLIDNYDSFSYNLYQAVAMTDGDIKVVRNDQISIAQIRQLTPSHIIISPGPGKPSDAGVCVEVIKQLYKEFPIFGVCLGHQAIYEAFGGTVSYAEELMHGKASTIKADEENRLFKGVPNMLKAARYHSLAAVPSTLPDELRVIAQTENGEIMAVCHKEYPIYGVQFHPESILTPDGQKIIENFLGIS